MPEQMNTKQYWAMEKVLLAVKQERQRQHEKWGEQDLRVHVVPGGDMRSADLLAQLRLLATDPQFASWELACFEEVFETFTETDQQKMFTEAIQAAAMFVQLAEYLQRKIKVG